MTIRRSLMIVACAFLVSGFLIVSARLPLAQAQTATQPTLTSLPFFPMMGGMMGMGGLNPWLYSSLSGLDTSTLGSFPYYGMMGGFGHLNPFLFGSLFNTTTATTPTI
ncbi:MAG: hypothetical protein ACMUIS_01880 [bacterium]